MSSITEKFQQAASKPRVAEYAAELLQTFDGAPTKEGIKAFVADAADKYEDLSPVEVREATALAIASRVDQRDHLIGLFEGTLAGPKLEALKTAVGKGIEELAKAPVVSDAELTQAMRPTGGGAAVGDDPGFGKLHEHLSEDQVKKLLREFQAFVMEQIGRTDGDVPETLLKLFIKRVEDTLGLKILRAKNLPELLREYGTLLVQMFERALPLVMVAGNESHGQEEALFRLSMRAGDALKTAGFANDVAYVGSFNHGGLAGRAFDAAKTITEFDRIGFGSRPSIKKEMAPSDKLTVFGNEAGEEIFLIQEMARRGVAVIVGGDDAALERARQVLAKGPKHVIVLGGYDDRIKTLDLPEGAHVFPDAAAKPLETGAALGELLVKLRKEDNAERYACPALQLAVRMAKGGMVDVIQHLEQNAAAYRIGRILSGVQQRLERTDMPRGEITAAVAMLGAGLATAVHGCDNISDNTEWKRRVWEVFNNSAPRVAALVGDIQGDVHFASWFGATRRSQEPSYFQKNTSKVPDEVLSFDYDGPHGFMKDLDGYAEKRFDGLTRLAFLDAINRYNAGDEEWQPEFFLGSQEEMDAYYRARGYSVGIRASDSNGTEYLIATKGDVRKPIIINADCEGRIKQVCALMQARGVDTSKILIRGEIARVRAQARNELMQQLLNLDLPVAFSVFNNKKEVAATLRELAGDATPKVSSFSIAGYEFDMYEVQATGGGKPHALLCFKPAYAERTEDAMEVVLSLKPVMVSIDGAGGATNKDDSWGTQHRVTEVLYKGSVYDLQGVDNIKLMDGPRDADTQDVVGIFHDSPTLQSKQYVTDMAEQFPNSVIDQEYGPGLAAVVRAATPRPAGYQPKPGEVILDQPIHVQSFIHKSDVAGHGYCEIITADAKYTPNVIRQIRHAVGELGIGSVKGANGEWVPLAGAATGILAHSTGGVDMSAIKVDEIPVPDHGTVGSANGINDVDQLKGQKRCVVVQTRNATMDDMEKLHEMIRQLDKDRYWLVFDQRDPKQGELVEMANQRGFESVVVATRDAVVLHKPTLIMRVDEASVGNLGADAAIEDRLRQVSQQGTCLDWFENYSLAYRIFAGDFTPPADVPQTRVQPFTSAEEMKAIRAAELEELKAKAKEYADQGMSSEEAFDAAQRDFQAKKGQSWYYFGALDPGAPPPIPPETQIYTRYLSNRRQAREQGLRMTAEVNQWVDGLDQALSARFAETGKSPSHINIDRVAEYFDGMIPFGVTAASAKSWAFLDEATKQLWVKTLQVCAKVLDKSKVFYVDGGTAFGLEAHGQKAFGEAGFKSFATLTEDAVADYSKQINPWLTHYDIVALNWAGKSRPLIRKVIERMRGYLTMFGGGEVVAREAELAMALGVRVLFMTEGHLSEAGEKELIKKKNSMEKVSASQFAGEKYKANAFAGIKELLGRLGISTQGLKPELLSNDISPETMQQIQELLATNDKVVTERYAAKKN